MTEIGARVFAVRDADEHSIRLFGFGTYRGKEIPPGRQVDDEDLAVCMEVEALNSTPERVTGYDNLIVKAWTEWAAAGKCTEEEADAEIAVARARQAAHQAKPLEERARDLAEYSLRNPRIDLDDDAGTVWGYQCWWGPIEKWVELSRGRTVIVVPLPGEPS